MPKIVSRETRREEVCWAAMRILARGGSSALTLRSLAAELGGSITLVTYFFDGKADLFEAIVDQILEDYTADGMFPASDDPVADLRHLVHWYIPETPEDEEREAGRVALITLRSQNASIDHFYMAMEKAFREVFGRVLRRMVEESQVEHLLDFLRAGVNGAVLSITEHPEIWSPARRERYGDALVRYVELFRMSSPSA